MSVKLMTLCFDVQGITPSEKAVLNAMADNAWDDGSSCYPSQGKLAHKTCFNKRTVGRALQGLKDKGLVVAVGKTSMNVVEYLIDIDKVSEMAVEYAPQRPYPHDTMSNTPSQGDVETVSEPPDEPSYVDDIDGVPDELGMEWDNFLNGWLYCFPDKAQPRPSNTSLRNKFRTRMKNTNWRNNWRKGLMAAKKTKWAHEDGWFKAAWVLKNDDNLFKLLDGTFDFKERGIIQVTDQKDHEVVPVDEKPNWTPAPGSV